MKTHPSRTTRRLASIFRIRPGETKLVIYVSVLFACLEAVRGIGGNAADSLFFVRFGVQFLPYMYLGLGAVAFVVVLGYTAGLGRIKKNRFFIAVLASMGLAFLVLWGLILSFELPALYAPLWIIVNLTNTLLVTLIWNIAAEVCDTRQARRLFPVFTSAAILGGTLGNFLTGPLARLLRTENLLLLCVLLLFLALALMRGITRRFFRPQSRHKSERGSLIAELQSSFDYTRRSRLMRLIVVSSVLFSVLYFSVWFPFSSIVSASFTDEAAVANFLGLFSGATTLVTLVVSLFISNRLFTRFGIVNANLILPLVYLSGFLIFSFSFTLAAAVFVRMAQLAVLMGISNSAWGALFQVIPVDKRSQAQSFQSALPAQVGIGLSGALLLLIERVFTLADVFRIGIVLALITSGLVWMMRRSYIEALVRTLRAGLVEVFTQLPRGLPSLDYNARLVLLAGLADPKPSVKRLSVELTGRLKIHEAVPPLVLTLEDPDAHIRELALGALARLDAREATGPVSARLKDPAFRVRAAALEALAAIEPDAWRHAASVLDDPHPAVRARASIILFRAGRTEPARSTVRALLDSTEPAGRSAGLEACGRLGVCFSSEQIAVYLKDESIQVRLAAVKALEAIDNEPAHRALLQELDDPVERVRLAAGAALQPSEAVWPSVLEVLNTGSERAQAAALVALEGRGASIRQGVTDWTLAQIPRALQLRAWAETLERSPGMQGSQALAFLAALLRRKERQAIQLVLQALALIGAPETMRLARRGLGSSEPEMRAQALEAIDTVGDKRITRGLLPLLEGPPPEPALQVEKVIGELSGHPDGWIRALAERAANDLQLSSGWLTAAGRLEQGGQTAAQTVRGGEMPETYQTLDTMDRILFLRQVPIFGELGPEDLQNIAEIASERIVLAGDYLCREGEIGDEMFILVEGEVRITRGEGDKERLLRIARAGEYIGEFAILRQQPRAANVVAQGGYIRVLALHGDTVKTILQTCPEVAMAMLANLAERLSTRE